MSRPRCHVCQKRHAPSDLLCPYPGELGYVTRRMLTDAFRCGDRVRLDCQSVWWNDGTLPPNCPDCGKPWERFEEDDLPPPKEAA